MKRVVVTGLGFVISIGHDRRAVTASLRELRHGIRPWSPGFETPVKVAGALEGFDVASQNPAEWRWPARFDLDPARVRSLPPHGVYALCALPQALAEAGLEPGTLSDGATGLHCASTGSPMLLRHHLNRFEATHWRRGHPLGVVSSIAGSLNFNLAAHLGIRGANCGFVSACTSSSHALGFAFDEIALGRQQRMIVIGAEDLNAESLMPFHAMSALSLNPDPGTASRPFDVQRDGFVGTGGAVALVLEEESVARERGARVQARMLGWAQASDGHHIAQPHPEGRGLQAAIERALASASAAPSAVDHVNCHATSTPTGDRGEAIALSRVFADCDTPMSSTKALTGHGLSLAGAMEAAFCVLAIDEGFTPGQAHLREPAPECAGLNFPLTTLPRAPRVVLNNNSGFGGTNVCHVFAAA